jgi:hypothetical protein
MSFLLIGSGINIFYVLYTLPFLADAYMVFVIGHQMDFSDELKEELLEKAAGQQQKPEPLSLIGSFERYVYSITDDKFMPLFCKNSFKREAFNLKGERGFMI